MSYGDVLQSCRILEVLERFAPTVVGALPLDLAVATSDIDIVCEAHDTNAFADAVWDVYRNFERFQLYRWREQRRPVVARFVLGAWPVELFGDPRPVSQQRAWRHFEVERRLLELDEGWLRRAVTRLRANGLKTEPAFAEALKLDGDPYEAMLTLFPHGDAELRARLAAASQC